MSIKIQHYLRKYEIVPGIHLIKAKQLGEDEFIIKHLSKKVID